jgi:hypothetical protein
MGGQGLVVILEKKKSIKSRFKICKIWPLNPIAMVGKFCHSRCSLQQKRKEHKMHTNQMQEKTLAIVEMKLKLPLIC